MPSTYTVNLGIEKPATGEQSGTWGDTVNDNSNILDEAINGVVSITLAAAGSSGSPNQIAITNGASSTGRNKWIEFADGGDLGATAYVELIPNDAEKICFIRNSLAGSRSILLFQGTYNASNDLEIAAGTDVVVKFSGTGTGATVVNINANLKVDGIVATTADINGGTVDATVIGGASAAALTATTVVANTSVNIAGDGATVTGIKDEDNMASNSATKLATQQSIKAYVDSQVGTVDTLAEILTNGNTTGSNDIDVDAAQKVQFRDAAIYINSSVDGQLDIVADTEIQIAATTIDINGAIVASGDISAASLDISGDVDIDGTLNVDAIDIDGAVQLDATLTVGVDDTGYDVKFYGATGGAYMLWDQSADDLILAGAGGLVVAGNVDFNGDLDVDGTTNLDVVDIDGAVDMASTLTVAGVLTGTSLDISGDIDVDGTTNLDVVDIDGAVDMASTLQVDGATTVDGILYLNNNGNRTNGGNLRLGISTDDTTKYVAITSTQYDSGTETEGYALISGTASDATASSVVIGGGIDEINSATQVSIHTASATTRSGTLRLKVDVNGTLTTYGTAIFNESGADADFRVESDAVTHCLFVDGGANSVGIGQSSPDSRLHVIDNTNSTIMPFIVGNENVTASSTSQVVQMGFGLARDSGTVKNNAGTISVGKELAWTGADGNIDSYMSFSTYQNNASNERLRIASNARQTINGSATANGHGNFVGEVGASSKALMFENTVGGGETGSITTGASSAAYNTSSDYRLKENIDYTWDATTRLKQLKPARFNFIIDDTNTLVDGFIAHEAQAVVPEAVHGTHNEVDADGNAVMQGIDQSKLVPLLVKTIQELEARITALES